jgi:multidrug efflux pump subunit AcrA (membrane-fusion protein)
MKLRIYFRRTLILALFLVAAVLVSCSKSGGGGDADDATPSKKDAETKAGVTLDDGTRNKLGVVETNPVAAEWRPEITAYGRVLDPIPLTDLFADLRRSGLAYNLAHQEFDRVKLLKKENNISVKAYQEAEGNYLQTQADMLSARRKVESLWGKKIAGMTGESVSDHDSTNASFFQDLGDTLALVRVDLPVGIRGQNNGGCVRIITLVENSPALVGTNFDQLPTMDPQTQQQGVLVTVGQSATNRLTPGEAVTVYWPSGGDVEQGVSVPAAAVVRYEGKGWVYTQTNTNQFVRREIPLERQLNDEYFIGNALSVTNRIILTGAQSVLSAELGGGFTTGERD